MSALARRCLCTMARRRHHHRHRRRRRRCHRHYHQDHPAEPVFPNGQANFTCVHHDLMSIPFIF